MTVEELLKPRYKVIADYPQYPYNTDSDEHKFIEGDLLIQCNVNGAITFKRHGRLGHMSVGVPCCSHPEKYPKVFRLLQWWEDRKPEEMPEYVKCIKSPDGIIQEGQLLKCTWNNHGGKSETMGWIFPYTNCYVPATQTEYESYINKQQP